MLSAALSWKVTIVPMLTALAAAGCMEVYDGVTAPLIWRQPAHSAPSQQGACPASSRRHKPDHQAGQVVGLSSSPGLSASPQRPTPRPRSLYRPRRRPASLYTARGCLARRAQTAGSGSWRPAGRRLRSMWAPPGGHACMHASLTGILLEEHRGSSACRHLQVAVAPG